MSENPAYTDDYIEPEGAEVSEPANALAARPLFEGDRGTLEAPVRRALTRLLRDNYVCSLTEPADYQLIVEHRSELEPALNNLGLTLKLSTRYEVAYAEQALLEEAGPLVLKRSQPLRRDATVLLVSIRARQHNDEANGEDSWFVEREDLKELLSSGPFAGEFDDTRVERALGGAIDQLVAAGYLREAGSSARYQVMPVLPAVFTLERAKELLASFGANPSEEAEA